MANDHNIVSGDEWVAARRQLLVKEKEFTRLRDQLSQQRRDLPWEAVTKNYVFEGPNGKQSLPDLFEGRIVHLNQRDVTMIAASRAPYPKLAAYWKRMGWSFKWVSSYGADFNFDYHVSFAPDELANGSAFYNFTMQDPSASEREGVSVFFKDATGKVFHTYSAYARGIDMLSVDYQYLDLVPKGRDEHGRGPYWVRRHDEYE